MVSDVLHESSFKPFQNQKATKLFISSDVQNPDDVGMDEAL